MHSIRYFLCFYRRFCKQHDVHVQHELCVPEQSLEVASSFVCFFCTVKIEVYLGSNNLGGVQRAVTEKISLTEGMITTLTN